MAEKVVKTLFLDVGGVLLSNGWDRQSRVRASTHFNLDADEVNERHHLTFDTFETGKLSLDEYLKRVIFYTKRNFTQKDFTDFVFKQSQPIDGSIEFFTGLKHKYHLRVIAVSNEPKEINEFRIKKYKLTELFDSFVTSCYVHLRKPDADIYRMACDIAQTPINNILYVDDRLLFVEVARSLNLHSYHFRRLEDAKKYINTLKFDEHKEIKHRKH